VQGVLRKQPFYFYLGLALIAAMATCIVLGLAPVTTWATPVLWSGLILICDAVLFVRTRHSVLRNGAIIPLAVISLCGWWMFEWFNIFLSNWHYLNLTEPLPLRYLGYLWSFATITPGILLVYGVLNSFIKKVPGPQFSVSKGLLAFMFLLGLLFIAAPIIPVSMYYVNRAADRELFVFLHWAANTYYAEYTAAFVWTGFVLLLEPLNYSMGNPSILREMTEGKYKPLALLALAGAVCGLLWEFWNYWAHTKWCYTVPILGHIKIFEMPVLGYLGFIPFAWELYAIVSLVYPRAVRIVEPDQS